MTPEIGRYFEGRLHEVQQMMLVFHDYCKGQGKEVEAWVDGRELVFGAKREGDGFLRVLPHEVNIVVSFPRGSELPDPLKRASGVPGSRTKITCRTTADIDPYVRRMVDAAYSLDK